MSNTVFENSSKQIPPHVQRMQEELDQLKCRMERLEGFILNKFGSISKQDGDLMVKQLQHMQGYRSVLIERIGRA